jgi:HD-like signal output (HDOD) protein
MVDMRSKAVPAKTVQNWLLRLVGRRRAAETLPAPVRHAVPATPAPTRVEARPASPIQGLLSSEQVEFLAGLIDPPPSRPMSAWAADDRMFLGGIQKRWHARQLELPVLPAAAIRLTEVLQTRDAPIAHLVDLIEGDQALSVEVIKCANSATLARGPAARSIHEAIMRIGLRRLGSVLLMAQLTTKVLKGGEIQKYAALLMDMVAPLGYLSGLLSKAADTEDGLSFIRGSLLHVEHMVILGAVPGIARVHKQALTPSAAALLQAFHQFGPEIRDAVATAWDMRNVLTAAPDIMAEYYGFRLAIALRWLGRPLPVLEDIDPPRLHVVLSHVRPRVNAADHAEEPTAV